VRKVVAAFSQNGRKKKRGGSMHTPHIKPQNNFGLPHGYEARKAKPKSVEAELITPVSEWECDGKKRKPASFARDFCAGMDEEQEAAAFEEAARRIDEKAAGKSGNASAGDKDELFGLLGAFAASGAALATKRQAAGEEDANLQDLLRQFIGAVVSGGDLK
jgi:hypothetical protein